MLNYEALPRLPASGAEILAFGSGGWSGVREGYVVRFRRKQGDVWIGNFQPGHGGWEGVLPHPDGRNFVVVAHGQVYVVDPEERALTTIFPIEVDFAAALPDLGAIVFSDGIRFEAIRSSGLWWQSPRISWDGFRNIKVEGSVLRGEAYSPLGEDWWPFTLDLTSGRCDDGIHEREMRGAIRIVPRRD